MLVDSEDVQFKDFIPMSAYPDCVEKVAILRDDTKVILAFMGEHSLTTIVPNRTAAYLDSHFLSLIIPLAINEPKVDICPLFFLLPQALLYLLPLLQLFLSL